MSRTNETLYINKNNETNESLYHILWLVTCACKYRLNKGRRDDRFIWNPSTFECNMINRVIFGNTWIMQILNTAKG